MSNTPVQFETQSSDGPKAINITKAAIEPTTRRDQGTKIVIATNLLYLEGDLLFNREKIMATTAITIHINKYQ